MRAGVPGHGAAPGVAGHELGFVLDAGAGGRRWAGARSDCNRCGQICPSGAIPNLPLAEKVKQLMGLASVDQPICINCMLCEPVCPTKAITRIKVRKASGMKPLPVVAADKCNGCGRCEFVCPAPPAIKVFRLGQVPASRKAQTA